MKAIGSDRIGVQIRSGNAGYIRRINTIRATPTTMTLKVKATLIRIANKDNDKLLSGAEITMGIQEFLEMGMKYKVNIESKKDKYTLEIETI